MKQKLSLMMLVAIAPILIAAVAPNGLDGTRPHSSARLKWWREARFGMFIHWGPVSLTGKEISWSRANSNTNCPNKGPTPVAVYDNLYHEFDPTNFNAREWVKIAKDAGMKYMVLTAKHCDGFCLWHTKVGDYHTGNSPFRRDVCGELAAAAHRAGMRIGWYYSPMDWWDPDCRKERNAAYVKRMQTHLHELLTNYGRIDLLWFDWDAKSIPWDQDITYRIVRTCQPKMIINNRLDSERGEHAADRYIGPNADYYTPEQVIGNYDDQLPWESCMTLGTQWSWKPDDKIKSVREALHILLKCAGGDGNLLLNVGPMPDGRIEPRQVEVLRGMGAWLEKYGQSVYRTRGGPFKPTASLVSTRRGKTIYVHVLRWEGERLRLPAIQARIVSATTLTGGGVKWQQGVDGISLGVDAEQRQGLDTIVVLRLDAPARNELAISAN